MRKFILDFHDGSSAVIRCEDIEFGSNNVRFINWVSKKKFYVYVYNMDVIRLIQEFNEESGDNRGAAFDEGRFGSIS